MLLPTQPSISPSFDIWPWVTFQNDSNKSRGKSITSRNTTGKSKYISVRFSLIFIMSAELLSHSPIIGGRKSFKLLAEGHS